MIMDKLGEFSVKQALTATAVSTNVIDLLVDRDIGPGRPMWIVLQLDEAADGTTADETYRADLQTATDEAFTTPVVIATATITRGDAKGKRYVIAMPYANLRYLRMNYTLGGTTPIVTLSTWLTDHEPSSWQPYKAISG